jgi:tricorn protease
MVALWGVAEDRTIENLQLEPDVKVENSIEDGLYGTDRQLEKGVEELLKEL